MRESLPKDDFPKTPAIFGGIESRTEIEGITEARM